jgi:hypothetical protein
VAEVAIPQCILVTMMRKRDNTTTSAFQGDLFGSVVLHGKCGPGTSHQDQGNRHHQNMRRHPLPFHSHPAGCPFNVHFRSSRNLQSLFELTVIYLKTPHFFVKASFPLTE